MLTSVHFSKDVLSCKGYYLNSMVVQNKVRCNEKKPRINNIQVEWIVIITGFQEKQEDKNILIPLSKLKLDAQ